MNAGKLTTSIFQTASMPSSGKATTRAARIARDLDAILVREGFATVAEAVGTGRKEWLP